MESGSNMTYLVAAYSAVWLVVAGYLFVLLKRNRRLNLLLSQMESRIADLEAKNKADSSQGS